MTNETPKSTNTYHEQRILTASPARLVIMLYEAAITSLNKAIKAIGEGDIKGRWAANKHAIDIIEQLLVTLDTERGGEIAANLERLYPFMIRHLIDVDLHNDPVPAREVIELLEPMHESWCELERRISANGAPVVPDTSQDAGQDAHDIKAAGYGQDRQTKAVAPNSRVSAIV